MNRSRFLNRFVQVTLALLPLLCLQQVQAQDNLPEPARLFTPNTALAVYLNLERSSQSGIWKTLENRLGPLQEQLSLLPQVPPQFATPLATMPGLQTGEIAELAIAIEGQNAFKNMETEQYDSDFSVVAAVRFKEVVDQEQLISQLLEEADKQKPGLRSQLEQSRKRVGAIDWFELPQDAMDAQLPFPLSLAIGPGTTGSIVGVGKSEKLREFVAGQTSGRLPAGIGPTMAQRGQMWLYFPVPAEMIKEMSAGPGADNPMMAGLSQGIEKIREFGVGMNFGNSAIGIELTLGCVDAAAASELQQGLQQFIGMMQMMASQNPSTPRLVSRLKTSTAGTAFRLTTEVTMQDVELGLKSAGIVPPPRSATQSSSGAPARVSGTTSTPAATDPPATVTLLELLPGDEQQLRYTRLQIDNRSTEAIKEIRLTFHYLDRAGRKIGQWTRRHQDPVSTFLAPAESTREVRCPTFHVPSTTDRMTITLHEVVFADGRKWTPAP